MATAAPLGAATRVTLPDLRDHPAEYYGRTVSVECHYDKESPIWVQALPDADRWLGFYVTGDPAKALSWSGEYYNLVFAPRSFQGALRGLRGGDKITVVAEAFHYHSASLDGAGLHVQQLLQGWGSSAKSVGAAASPALPGPPSAPPIAEAPRPAAPAATPAVVDKYAVTINGKRYQGLRFGDRYNFDGVEFQVEPPSAASREENEKRP